MSDYNLIVIGGGPGGYVAAIRASQLGLKVALVEKAHMGGICLNWGCIPTKALLRCSEIHHLLNHLDDYGFKAEKVSFDFQKIIERSRGVATQLSNGIRHLMKKNKIDVIDGEAKVDGKSREQHQVKVGDKIYKAKNVILATGARPRIFPGLEPDHKLVWTYKEAMIPETLPKSLLVIGTGAIGVEFASFYKTMGSQVTLVEVLDRILPVEDPEISELAKKAFEKQGIKIHTSTKVANLKKGKDTVTATFERAGKSHEENFDRVIVAVGVVGNTENLGLEKTKVKVEKNQIITNEWCETNEPGIYAIGDVTSAPWLAHKASHEGVLCVEKMAGHHSAHPLTKMNIPGCTYSLPQIASIGLTEHKAKELGYTIQVGRFPFMGNGKAIAMGEPEGLVKTIFDAKTGELLGAHMIGAEVTEMIQGFTIAKTLEATEEDLIQTVFPHPTLSEMMHESVLSAYGRALHI
ncbi:Dihydrolipoyl dehydrogenase [Candidatus Bealeia paramacronuclearis]|uniref:Dihydrolipoyl dehydrogenase n=1 Tax=Candidatus Bealeia paramacronuclearis TaxID=1921001 RepID=A0ABZ2C1X8_9PROT|nr:Dihydrolipoyl dehydrogenase [Candidatus Bealeia paramacronuclearis]